MRSVNVKRLLAIGVSVVMLVCFIPVVFGSLSDRSYDGRVDASEAEDLTDEEGKTVYKIGDLDGDGKITAADARLVLRYSVRLDDGKDVMKKTGISVADLERIIDADSDGDITAADARLVLRTAVRLDSLPVTSFSA